MLGVISKVYNRPTQWGPMFSFQINGSKDYFGTGKTPPPPAGTSVSFDVDVNPKGFNDAKNIQIMEDKPVQSGVSVVNSVHTPQVSRDEYWTRKEENDLERQRVIELQSCRNSAIELVRLLITPSGNGEVGLKLPAQAKREEFLVSLVNKYTMDFVAANHNENNNDEPIDPSVDESASGEWNVE